MKDAFGCLPKSVADENSRRTIRAVVASLPYEERLVRPFLDAIDSINDSHRNEAETTERIQSMYDTPETSVPETDFAVIIDAMAGGRGEDQKRIADEGVSWVATLLAKNDDYGSSAWERPVLAERCGPGTSILVRMSDKIQRLKTLLCESEGRPQIADETVEDTIRDLGAYCLLYLARPKSE